MGELGDAARADGVTHVAVNESGVFEDGGGGRGLGVDGEVGEEAALGVGKGAGDEMEGGKGDDGVAEAAEPVHQHPLRLLVHHACSVERFGSTAGLAEDAAVVFFKGRSAAAFTSVAAAVQPLAPRYAGLQTA